MLPCIAHSVILCQYTASTSGPCIVLTWCVGMLIVVHGRCLPVAAEGLSRPAHCWYGSMEKRCILLNRSINKQMEISNEMIQLAYLPRFCIPDHLGNGSTCRAKVHAGQCTHNILQLGALQGTSAMCGSTTNNHCTLYGCSTVLLHGTAPWSSMG